MNKLRLRSVSIKISCLIIGIIYSSAIICRSNDSIPRKKIYHVNYFTGSLIIAGGLVSDYPAIGRIKGKADLSNDEVANLNTSLLNPLDRWATEQNPSHYKIFSTLSDEVQIPMYVIIPAILAFDKKIRKDWLDLLFMYVEGHVITFTFYNYS